MDLILKVISFKERRLRTNVDADLTTTSTFLVFLLFRPIQGFFTLGMRSPDPFSPVADGQSGPVLPQDPMSLSVPRT